MDSLPTVLMGIPDGKEGTRATLKIMRSLVRGAKKDPQIVLLSRDIVRYLPNKAWSMEAAALFDFVKTHVRYTEDITNVETVQSPSATLAIGTGDCDDMAVLLASLLEAIGKPTRFVAVGFEEPDSYEHVFTQVRVGDKWISLDPTENQPIGWTPPDFVSWMICDN